MNPRYGSKRPPTHSLTLRTRRRWTTYAYVALALSAGYVLLGYFRGSHVALSRDAEYHAHAQEGVPWRTGNGKILENFQTKLAGWNGKADKLQPGTGKERFLPKIGGDGKAVGKKKKGKKGKAPLPVGQDMRPNPLANERPLPPKHDQKVYREHKLLPNGLLQVVPGGRHPIFELIERGEQEWSDKLAKSSRSLDEAVAEYKWRYGRNPPKGFDLWWDYVEEHNVLLPDEYDMIHHDLEPFWGISPQDMRDLETKLEGKKDTWTMGKTSHHGMMLVNMSLLEDTMKMHLEAAYLVLDTLRPVQDNLPHFRAVFSPHDTPEFSVSHEFKSLSRAAARAGKYLDIDNLQVESVGWLSGCAKSSLARNTPFNLADFPPPPKQKTFIYDAHRAMDPCRHPTLLHHHGQFFAHEHGEAPVVPSPPGFGYSTTTLHSEFRVANPLNWVEDIREDSTWGMKRDDRLLWRGSNTGIWHGKSQPLWRQSHRERMVKMADETKGTVEVLVADGGLDEGFKAKKFSQKRVNGAMLDMAFAREPLLCEEDVCEEMRQMFDYAEPMDFKAAGEYKYVMDIDGNGWSSRFQRLMTSHALVFKTTVYPEWFQDRIQPWVHYVPVQMDFSDLYDALAFFRGDVSGNGAHDDLAERIASAGREWSRTMWRREDMTAYNYRLILEYARLMADDREEMTYTED